uniref:NMD3 domain-containing protein n=1 Tax=Strongyloides papillosus TaxID=174720 RepID=A0A0N5CIP4_STREA
MLTVDQPLREYIRCLLGNLESDCQSLSAHLEEKYPGKISIVSVKRRLLNIRLNNSYNEFRSSALELVKKYRIAYTKIENDKILEKFALNFRFQRLFGLSERARLPSPNGNQSVLSISEIIEHSRRTEVEGNIESSKFYYTNDVAEILGRVEKDKKADDGLEQVLKISFFIEKIDFEKKNLCAITAINLKIIANNE